MAMIDPAACYPQNPNASYEPNVWPRIKHFNASKWPNVLSHEPGNKIIALWFTFMWRSLTESFPDNSTILNGVPGLDFVPGKTTATKILWKNGKPSEMMIHQNVPKLNTTPLQIGPMDHIRTRRFRTRLWSRFKSIIRGHNTENVSVVTVGHLRGMNTRWCHRIRALSLR